MTAMSDGKVRHRLEVKASDPAGMTLDELAAFVERAREGGADGSQVPRVVTRMRGTIKVIAVNVEP